MNLELKILIVEDSISFAIELDSLISKIGYTVQKIVDNAEEAYQIINREVPDLILLDIELNGKMTGIDLSNKITDLQIPIIFITSSMNEAYYTDAKQANMLAYLSKPISSFSLKASIEIAIHNFYKTKREQKSPSKEYLLVKKNEVFYKIKLSDIAYIKSDSNYCEIFTTKNELYLLREKISNILDNLIPKEKFIRIHRKFIVQLDKVNFYDMNNNEIRIDSVAIPVSRTYKNEIQFRLNVNN